MKGSAMKVWVRQANKLSLKPMVAVVKLEFVILVIGISVARNSARRENLSMLDWTRYPPYCLLHTQT